MTSRARNQAPFWIDPNDASSPFPDAELALREPDGLLAIGGDLSAERLLRAYAAGIFPWYSEGQPVLWWSPDPRFVLFPQKLKVSRSLHKTLRSAAPDDGVKGLVKRDPEGVTAQCLVQAPRNFQFLWEEYKAWVG